MLISQGFSKPSHQNDHNGIVTYPDYDVDLAVSAQSSLEMLMSPSSKTLFKTMSYAEHAN